jgi:hypothetical protein
MKNARHEPGVELRTKSQNLSSVMLGLVPGICNPLI